MSRIKWNPIVLSFSLSSKRNHGDDDLAPYQYRLEPLDIKTIHDCVIGKTTHLVAAKRNTAKGLQALIQGRPIVGYTFVDALVSATTPVPNQADPSDPLPSPLEDDFDANFPNPLPYLPDASKEPVQRPPEAFSPNPERAEVFSGFTFVFLDSDQYEILQDPINDGHGKALIYELEPGQTTVNQVVEYVTNVSGYKDINELQSATQNKKGVVVVRMRPRGEWHDWTLNLQGRVDQKLGLRSVDQNEFLDFILQNDASVLRRPIEDGGESESQTVGGSAPEKTAKPSMNAPSSDTVNASSSSTVRAPTSDNVEFRNEQDHARKHEQLPSQTELKAPPSSVNESTDTTQADQREAKQSASASAGPTRRRGRRGMITSRFAGFDDFDASQSVQDNIKMEKPESSPPQTSAPAKSTRSQTSVAQITSSQPPATQKRPPSPLPDPEAAVDELLPGAAAMKRRRLEHGTPGPETGSKRKTSGDIREEPTSSKKPKTKVEDVDYSALLRSRREAEDEAARQDQEALKEALAIEGLSVEDMKNLVNVEEMDMPVRSRSFNIAEKGESDRRESNKRWEERWNGRKNFKGFKRKGHEGEAEQRRHKVFVPMEDAKPKSFGLGEEYWNDLSNRNRSSNDTQSQPERSRGRRAAQLVEEEDPNKFRRRRGINREARQEGEESPVVGDVESEDVTQSTRNEQLRQKAKERASERGVGGIMEGDSTQHPTQTLRAETQTQKGKGKRPARGEPELAPQPKRQSRLNTGQKLVNREDEGDDLKFRFRRRRQE